MQAEIIAIGDELASGQRLDTNSQWLSQQLGYLGIPVARHVTVGDNMQSNISVLQEAAVRSQVVIVSGGLGPTLDDLTREAMATAFDLPLELHEDSLAHIEQLFAQRGRPMPERNRVQALFPRGTVPIPNPHGSAPGIDLTVSQGNHQCRFFALPGVPAEMKQMWQATVEPRLEQLLGADRVALFFRSVKLFGLGESDVEARVPTLIARDRYPTVGITVSQATITLRVAGRAKSEAEFEQQIAPTLSEIHEKLGELIFGYGDDELSDALLRSLVSSGNSLAVLEIGAGNWVNEAMQAATGYSGTKHGSTEAYRGGLALPNIEAAGRWLVERSANSDIADDNLLIKMTQAIRMQLGASIGICISAYPSQAEIRQAAAGKTFPFTIVIAAPGLLPEGYKIEYRNLGGHPEVLNARVAKTAMDILRKILAPQPRDCSAQVKPPSK